MQRGFRSFQEKKASGGGVFVNFRKTKPPAEGFSLIPGKKAPLLIPDSMLENMNPGAVIVDMAVSQGGNCESSILDKIVVKNGVKIIGEGNLPSTLAMNASELFAKNIQNFLMHLSENCAFKWDLEDEITAGSLIIKSGEILNKSLKELILSKEIA